MLFKQQISTELALEHTLNEEHPDLLHSHNCLTYTLVVLNNQIKQASVVLVLLCKGCNCLSGIAPLLEHLSPDICAHLLIASVAQVTRAVRK
jgi:hypothetical protein